MDTIDGRCGAEPFVWMNLLDLNHVLATKNIKKEAFMHQTQLSDRCHGLASGGLI